MSKIVEQVCWQKKQNQKSTQLVNAINSHVCWDCFFLFCREVKYKSRYNWSTQLIHTFVEIVFFLFCREVKYKSQHNWFTSLLRLFFSCFAEKWNTKVNTIDSQVCWDCFFLVLQRSEIQKSTQFGQRNWFTSLLRLCFLILQRNEIQKSTQLVNAIDSRVCCNCAN
jgi:hypothetical protein